MNALSLVASIAIVLFGKLAVVEKAFLRKQPVAFWRVKASRVQCLGTMAEFEFPRAKRATN